MLAPAHTTHAWRFGVFEVDASSEDLRRAGIPIKLREQSFRILVLLLEHAGELVTREDLRKALWPADTYVDFDHSLNTAVMKLREALGDTADKPLYIETVPKRGYRFIAPVVQREKPDSTLSSRLSSSIRPTEQTRGPDSKFIRIRELLPARLRDRVIAGMIGLLLLFVVGLATLVWTHNPTARLAKPDKGSSTRPIVPIMTEPGNALFPVFSPSGAWIAFIWNGPGRNRYDLYVQLLGSAVPLRLNQGKGGLLSNPTWSPDGTQIAFTRCNGRDDGVFVIPALGGNERKLTTAFCGVGLASTLAWLSDGTGILMVDHCTEAGPLNVVLFSFATGKKGCITDLINPGRPFGISAFKLSPDGTSIAFRSRTAGKCCDLYSLPLAGGVPKQLTFDLQMDCDTNYVGSCTLFMWTPDSKSVIFASRKTSLPWLWRVSASGGAIEAETEYPGIGDFSKDGRRFVYAEKTNDEPPAIWKADLAAPGGQVLNFRKFISSQDWDMDAQPSPDGKQIVWMSGRSGMYELWIDRATGGNPLQLTHLGGYAGTPRWSPNGKWIAFDHPNEGYSEIQICVIDSEGRNMRPITAGPYRNVVPSWSRDGKSIYYASNRSGSMQVWRHSLENATEEQLTQHGGFDPMESFDGQTVYFSKFNEAGIWSMASRGGTESLVVADKPQASYWGYWAVTKAGLYFLDVEAEPKSAIEFYDFATRRISPVLTVDKQLGRGQPSFSASMDGKTIYFAQMDQQSAIRMIELAR